MCYFSIAEPRLVAKVVANRGSTTCIVVYVYSSVYYTRGLLRVNRPVIGWFSASLLSFCGRPKAALLAHAN